MKKGFTLVELLIVVVVITILMSITFKIMSIGEDQTARIVTITRLQALENAIGGYYAAFGSYPPVPLHASRDYRYETNCMFVQETGKEVDQHSRLSWQKVRAACKAQPLGMSYPCKAIAQDYAERLGEKIAGLVAAGDGRVGNTALLHLAFGGTVDKDLMQVKEDTWKTVANQQESGVTRCEWGFVQCFRFGLMSFLLPRYLLMMNGPDPKIYDTLDQWGSNNTIPCDFETGIQYDSWEDLARDAKSPKADNWSAQPIGNNYWKVALLPSQIVTARWIANFEKMLAIADPTQSDANGNVELYVYGVNIASGDFCGASTDRAQTTGDDTADMWVYSSGASQSSDGGGVTATQTYALDGITCWDGWSEEFYYYSPPPYQGYRLWSSGKNMRTFPPWVTEGEINQMETSDAKTARSWKADDIVHMNN